VVERRSIPAVNPAYLLDIIVLLTAAVIVVPMSRFVGLGIVPGFLIAGIAVGPSALSLIDNQAEITHLAELGVVLLLFVIGIELKPARLWLMRRMVFGLGALQVIVTGALITAAAYFIFGLESRSAILIGPVLALSSTAFVLQLLSEQKLLASDYGRTSVAILLFQDLAVVPLLTLATLLTVADLTIGEDIGLVLLVLVEAVVVLALVIFGGRYLLQPILQRVALLGSPEVFTTFTVLLVLGTHCCTDDANRPVHGHGCICSRTVDCQFRISSPDRSRGPTISWTADRVVLYVDGHVF